MHTLKDFYFLRFGGSFFRKVKDLKNGGYIFNDPRRRVLSLDPLSHLDLKSPRPSLPEDVRNLGPLWTHSTFPFENLNGELLKLFHGTQNIVFQIVSAVNINRALPTLSNALVEGSDSYRFYSKLASSRNSQNEVEIATNVFAVGKVTSRFLQMFLRLYPIY